MYLQGPLFLLCALAALMFDGTNSIELDKIHLDYFQSVIAQFMASKGKSSLKYTLLDPTGHLIISECMCNLVVRAFTNHLSCNLILKIILFRI